MPVFFLDRSVHVGDAFVLPRNDLRRNDRRANCDTVGNANVLNSSWLPFVESYKWNSTNKWKFVELLLGRFQQIVSGT